MKRQLQPRRSPAQRGAAAVCLLALLLVYAPMTSAALLVATGNCCTGDVCAIHGHHQSKPQRQQNDSAPMDCDHEHQAANTMQSCTISCCQDAPALALHGYVFAAPLVPVLGNVSTISFMSLAPMAPHVSFLSAPAAPPPKFLAV